MRQELATPGVGDYRVFASDAHIPATDGPHERRDKFIHFLASMQPAPRELYLLGDIFEFWYEYPSVMYSSYFRLLHQLACLAEKGTEVHLVTGNHDFWAGPLLSSLVPLMVHHDCLETTISGLRTTLCHRDGLAPEDRGYRRFRAFLRSRFCRWGVGLLRPSWSVRLSEWVAARTRKRSSRSDEKDRAALIELARRRFEAGVKVFCCAHLHAPEIQVLEGPWGRGLFVNVGDWWKSDSYVIERNGRFCLCLAREDPAVWPGP